MPPSNLDDLRPGVQNQCNINDRHHASEDYAGQILFEATSSTFRMYGKSMMYAFRADENGSLEHLYWGSAIPPTDDLRFLSFSNVQLCFDPGPYTQFEFENTIPIEDLFQGHDSHDPHDLLREWERARKQIDMAASPLVNGEFIDHASDERRGAEACSKFLPHDIISIARRENAAWRLMRMQDLKSGKIEEFEYELGVSRENKKDLSPELTRLRESHTGFPRSSSSSEMHHGFQEMELEHPIPQVGRNTKLLEYADLGTGDYRAPSFSVVYEDGGAICPLTYKAHRIMKGKLPMTAAKGRLPELRGGEEECSTLVVEMQDKVTGLEFDLIYTVFKHVDAMSRRVIVRNPRYESPNLRSPSKSKKVDADTLSGDVRIDKLMSATVDFHTMSNTNMITLSGSWANERHIQVQPLIQGKFVTESLRGTSSHQHNPFCALTNTSEEMVETVGEVWGFSLVYSGNFMIEADVSETGRTRINAGISSSTFKWHVPAGDSFEGPECVLVYSDRGLEGMTHAFHDLYRNNLIPSRWHNTIPPVLLNTWETTYFDVSHAKILEIAKIAVSCGVEMIVLDDGWFGQRDDATSSLGDWYEDKRKFPEGLCTMVKEINELGLKFGIWIEPEMVNVRSKLYAAHPNWCLNQQGRNSRCEGRNQLVLDFTREEVREHVIAKLDALLTESNIEYLKWDMNRHLTEVYGNAISPQKQGEVFHRYMVGVYKVLAHLNEKFPHVRIETCSGGGGRFDAGMLNFCPQIWASDNTDVFSRLAIQSGTSLIYPLSTIGAHITTVPNHQTQRLSTLKTRFLVSLFGNFGLELDLRKLSQGELHELSSYISKYKELAPVVLFGKFYRLWSPANSSDQEAYAWMCTNFDNDNIKGVVAVFLNKVEAGRYLPRLRLRGLKEDDTYIVEEIFPNSSLRNRNTGQLELGGGVPQWQTGRHVISMSGSMLMGAGMPIRLSYDGDSCAFILRER
eukprot:273556-Hanusia_phi.AAC.3